MIAQFTCDRAIFRVVPRGAPCFDAETALTSAFPAECTTALVGFLSCPRGCGATIYWALTPEMAEYKEQFLLYLHQLLSWTSCPDHSHIQGQRMSLHADSDWSALPSSSSVLAGGQRYRNLYE